MIIYGASDPTPVNLDNINDLIVRLPLPGEPPLPLFAGKRDNAADFIRFFCEVSRCTKIQFEETIFTSFNINQDAAELIEHYRKNNLLHGKTYVLFNDFVLRQDGDRSRFVRQALESSGATIAAANIHAKLQLYRSGAHHYVVEGSGNLTENSNLECYTIHNDQRLYAFRRAAVLAFFGIHDVAPTAQPTINFNHIGGN